MSPLVVKWLDRFNSPEGFTVQRWVSTKLGFPKNSYFSDLCIEYNLPKVVWSFFSFSKLCLFLFSERVPWPAAPLHRLSDQSFIGAVARILFRVAKDSISFCHQNIIGARHNIQRGMRRSGLPLRLCPIWTCWSLLLNLNIFSCQTNTF